MFSDRSMYMQIATGRFAEGYSKNTVYRFLNSIKTNWERFTILLSEKEIIRIYGKRWDIEVFFKTCKSMLKLETGCHSLSYDAMTAYVSIVFTRYMLLSVEKRIDEDDRTAGELFYLMCDELQDITFSHSMSIIAQAFLDSVIELLHLTDEQVLLQTTCFFTRIFGIFLQHSIIYCLFLACLSPFAAFFVWEV